MSEAEAGPPEDLRPAPPVEPSPKGSRTTLRLIVVLSTIAVFMASLLLVRSYALTPFRIPTSSMEPALLGESPQHPGDTIVVNRLAYLGSGPGRWEVVAFLEKQSQGAGGRETPETVNVVKRVVGLPGERVEISGGEVYVNGKREPKPPPIEGVHYIASGSFGWSPVDLGPEEYFVLGDNSYLSQDSRRIGPIHRKDIFGRVEWIIWPWSRMGWVK